MRGPSSVTVSVTRKQVDTLCPEPTTAPVDQTEAAQAAIQGTAGPAGALPRVQAAVFGSVDGVATEGLAGKVAVLLTAVAATGLLAAAQNAEAVAEIPVHQMILAAEASTW